MAQEPSDPRPAPRPRHQIDDPALISPAPVQTEEATSNSAGMVQRERVVSDDTGSVHSERVVRDIAGEQRIGLARTTRLIWLVFGIIEGLIALRIVLKLIGSNPDNSFARLVYGFSDIFVQPFATLTGSPAAGNVVLEIPSIIAILVYALVAWVIVQVAMVLWPMFSQSTTESTSTRDRFRS